MSSEYTYTSFGKEGIPIPISHGYSHGITKKARLTSRRSLKYVLGVPDELVSTTSLIVHQNTCTHLCFLYFDASYLSVPN